MIIKGRQFSVTQILCLIIYYGIGYYLPKTGSYFNIGGRLRYLCCKKIFKKCGLAVNIERKATFGRGTDIEIGDNSGIGINAVIPSDTIIGKNVMMGPNVYILTSNHSFDDI